MSKKKTVMVDLGTAEDLATHDPTTDVEWNFVLIHRSNEPLVSWWGNMCGHVQHRLIKMEDSGKPWRWYHDKLYNFVSNQNYAYGDYYRLLDNSFGTAEHDVIYEEKRD